MLGAKGVEQATVNANPTSGKCIIPDMYNTGMYYTISTVLDASYQMGKTIVKLYQICSYLTAVLHVSYRQKFDRFGTLEAPCFKTVIAMKMSLRAKRSNLRMGDCFVAVTPRNDLFIRGGALARRSKILRNPPQADEG